MTFWGGTHSGLALFFSAMDDGQPHVDVELWASQLPQPEGDWDFSIIQRLTVGGCEQCSSPLSPPSRATTGSRYLRATTSWACGAGGATKAQELVATWAAEDAAAWEAGEIEDEDDEE